MSSVQINNESVEGHNRQNFNEEEATGIGQKNISQAEHGIQLARKPPPLEIQDSEVNSNHHPDDKLHLDYRTGQTKPPNSNDQIGFQRNLSFQVNDSQQNSDNEEISSAMKQHNKSKFSSVEKPQEDLCLDQKGKQKKNNLGKKKDDKVLLNNQKPVSKHIVKQLLINYSNQKNIICLLDNKFTTIFMTLITIWALFGDDIRLLAAQKKHDDGFFGMMIACLVFFTLQVVLASIAKKDYFFGFYFWLDIISTLSLIPDIGWFWDPIIGAEDVSASNSQQVTSIVSASRGARVGTKAGRVVRIIRLIRLIRIVKLYKHAQNAIEQGPDSQKILPLPTMPAPAKNRVRAIGDPPSHQEEGHSKEMVSNLNDSRSMNNSAKGRSDKKKKSLHESVQQKSSLGGIDRDDGLRRSGGSMKSGRRAQIQPVSKQQNQENAALPEESKVGKKLSDLTTRRVIILVLIMMFSVPLFTLSTYTDVDSNTGFAFGLQLIFTYAAGTDQRAIARSTYITQYDGINTPLIYLRTGTDSDNFDQSPDPNDLRVDEKEFVTLSESNQFVAIFDLRSTVRLNAGLGIARTVFICIVLAGGAIFFSKDANDLVIGPIEAMMQKVKKISENPLVAAQQEENQALLQEITKNKQESEQKKKGKQKKKKKEAPYETQILEQTLIKIGALLALGFGQAGSKIIAENMKATGDVNPMIPGNKIIAIFGFCDIRQFTDATEILQEDVMLFVNEIAEIVHSIVDQFSGAANKNIGDAFLLVWKFREEDMDYDQESDGLTLVQCHQVQQVADMSVLSFLKIIARINRSNKLSKYREYPELNRRMPNYRVRMGFGLHVGWAIEGAIGSDFKIDASYLSPNVNMASRLEAATKQFGTPLLISGQLHNLFSDVTKRYMRMIDRVTVKGSLQPLDLYTCDMDIKKIDVDPPDAQVLTKQERKRLKVRARIIRDRMRDAAFNNIAPVCALFETDEDFYATVGTYPVEFYQTFNKGFKHYLDGNWGQAKSQFVKVNEIKGEADLPCENLLNIMEGHNFKAPNDWQGYRSLTQK